MNLNKLNANLLPSSKRKNIAIDFDLQHLSSVIMNNIFTSMSVRYYCLFIFSFLLKKENGDHNR
jgi:hypothetical protein